MIRQIIIASALAAGMQCYAHGLLEKHQRTLTDPRSYVCYRAQEPIKIDGKLDEKSWQLAKPTAEFVDISGEGYAKPKYSTTAKMLWDDEYLYIGAVLEEPNIIANLTQRDTIIYHDNDFEVFIDPDGNGQSYFEFETNARGVLFDLLLEKAYRSGGTFLIPWNCEGLQMKVTCQGTLNNPKDTDKSWTVEMAIPAKSLTLGFESPLKAGNVWRLNFSRVQWLKKGGPEENWVWSPTGKVDMHMPDRWGFVEFSPAPVGTSDQSFNNPYNMDVYKLLWAMFYEQQAYHAKHNNYIQNLKAFWLCDHDKQALPAGSEISVEATSAAFSISISDPAAAKVYSLDQDGRFSVSDMPKREVSNFVWVSPNYFKTPEEWQEWFAVLKPNGITGVMFEFYDEDIYRMAHEAGLQAHHWKWTMNRKEVMDTHPEWFAVNRKGESSFDKPAYVEYYRFLCPNREGVAEYLAEDYVKELQKPYVDGVHLDYVRMPDIVLPTDLWKNYGIEQTQELPEYDYCYCEVCREKYKAQTGVDPLDLKYPMNTPSWVNFRLNSITAVVDSITKAVKEKGGHISAAVFPTPAMSRCMVRQNWGTWNLDAYYPMIYNGFYGEGLDWIGEATREGVDAVGDRAKIYTGLFMEDINDHFIEAVEIALDNGASGVSFFQSPTAEQLKEFKAYLDKKGYSVK